MVARTNVNAHKLSLKHYIDQKYFLLQKNCLVIQWDTMGEYSIHELTSYSPLPPLF